MSRATLILSSDADREKARDWIVRAPVGTRVEYKRPKRTLPQNDYMWALLTDIAEQAEHGGRKYSTDVWKAIFMNALGRDIQLVPSLDGKNLVPIGQSSSDLSKQEMTDMIELMLSWGADNSIVFHDTPAQRESA